ncbi:MAG: metallohydrolase [Cenarchaeum sp. SB0669_bin_11]|nr:metallohydrolase [Acidobacteriota bacterium]MYH22503.1 metallohydrolase [Acidobacteriota bacterium]MYL11947.1 metallohydrolase [Cenarchaeum sp. SB0669_bin_11]
MEAKISFFPVGNGDMTLITTESGRRILIDMNIRADADDPDKTTPDVTRLLRDRLTKDSEGRYFVDVLLVSHPDQDHCRGLRKHFHLGPPAEWSNKADKIFVREIWSSPRVFRRASKNNPLCDDAKAFNREAKRRVGRFRDSWGFVGDGDRVLILGEDEDGKTDDLGKVLVTVDTEFDRICGTHDSTFRARLLGPLPQDDDADGDVLSKNNSSTILRFSLAGGGVSDKGRFLTGGDAEVEIWRRLWGRHERRIDWLSYDLLQTPHHCSWHSLSYDSWSEKGEDAEVCEEARSALAQARGGATIVSSSNPIKDDKNDPPCIRAKREYESIVAEVSGVFRCVGEHPNEHAPAVLDFEVTRNGLRWKPGTGATSSGSGSVVGRQPLGHG